MQKRRVLSSCCQKKSNWTEPNQIWLHRLVKFKLQYVQFTEKGKRRLTKQYTIQYTESMTTTSTKGPLLFPLLLLPKAGFFLPLLRKLKEKKTQQI